MNFKIRYNLWVSKHSLNPSAAFKYNLKNRLLAAHDAKSHSLREFSCRETLPKENIFGHSRLAWASAFVLLLVSFFGTGAYAYASPSVTEEEIFLYPIKQQIEKVEEWTMRTPEAKAKFNEKMEKRRQAEAEVLTRRREKRQEEARKKIEQRKEKIKNQRSGQKNFPDVKSGSRPESRSKFGTPTATSERRENKINN